MGFFVAMRTLRSVASSARPQTVLKGFEEYLIVSRSGELNQFLEVSNAGAAENGEDRAPAHIAPEFVIDASLVGHGTKGDEIFLVDHDRHARPQIDACPLRADGYIRLHCNDSGFWLTGAIRLWPEGQPPKAVEHCMFLGDDEPGATLYLDATYLPWERELLPDGGHAEWRNGSTEAS